MRSLLSLLVSELELLCDALATVTDRGYGSELLPGWRRAGRTEALREADQEQLPA